MGFADVLLDPVCVTLVLTDTLGTRVFEVVCVTLVLTDTLGTRVFEVVCVILALSDTLGTRVFEIVCDILDVNDWDELPDKVVEPLADIDGPVVLLIESDRDTVAEELAVCVSDKEIDAVAAILLDGDTVSEVGGIVELTEGVCDADELGSLLCDADVLCDTDILCNTDLLTDSDKLGAVLCDTDVLADTDEVGSLLCDTDVLADTDELGAIVCDNDELPVTDSVDENDTDSDADKEAVALELDVCDKVCVILALDEEVAVILVLWDAIVVTDPLILCDTSLVVLGLDEIVADVLELGVREIDGVGEVESTDPAPTATNAIFVDCNQLVTVTGSVSPTV